MGKTVIIGLDGVPYHLMDELSDKGVMPNFKKLKDKGIFKEMESAIPEISSVSWSSIIRNPSVSLKLSDMTERVWIRSKYSFEVV